MRTALSPILISSPCLFHHSQVTACRHSGLAFVSPQAYPFRRPVAHFSTAPSRQRWDLTDLRRVSEEVSPLIFHLTSDNPYHNLSIEHYILTNSHPSSRILLFYTNRPCVVIGRNQNPWLETDIKRLKAGLEPEGEPSSDTSTPGNDKPQRTPIDLIRRRSGGGTVFHDDGNLNYSVIVPNSKSFKRSTHAEMVVRALTPLSSRYGFSEVEVNDRNDIVMRSKDNSQEWLKVSGSAYKLTKGRALHHGTLLYSSPNLMKISDLLRSPGRDFIQAKGVESVRSKVGNLAWTPDSHSRQEVKQAITEAIVHEFWNMYGNGQPRKVDHNEVYLGDDECDKSNNMGIASGVEELKTDAWLFEQTPRFDFFSGVIDETEVNFQVNHGTIVQLILHHHGEKVEVGEQTLRNVGPFNHEGKLLRVVDWNNYLRACVEESTQHNANIPKALVDRIQAIFPSRQATS